MNKKTRGCCFTLNIEDGTMERQILFEKNIVLVLGSLSPEKWVFQLEKGDTGNLHYQGFVYCSNPRWMNSIKKSFNNEGMYPHLESSRDCIASYKYCEKEATRVRGPFRSEGGELGHKKFCRICSIDEYIILWNKDKMEELLAKDKYDDYIKYMLEYYERENLLHIKVMKKCKVCN